MLRYLTSISGRLLLLLLLLLSLSLHAQDGLPLPEEESLELPEPAEPVTFPHTPGSRVTYNAMIEAEKGYVGGICVLANDSNVVKGCLLNEFGISALEFIYIPADGKVELLSVISMLDKWYIRKVLKKDLALLMRNLQQGVMGYTDEKYKLDFKFSLLENETEE